ncbi:GNAT family N-acetyltransferase [Rhizomonospora bruguierae]|uniref:GNAT family N-acetyltransferase n=1 Tax=Rhizomonospora bruguierae TaxID=1581705 RepID=UPI001BCAE62D|nr:GNAT family N-acetyltransferase [Micromonospora sp. NBRC 107566]
MEPVEITEDDLLLRPWHPADAEAVYRACQDPDIQRWTTVPAPYLLTHATAFVGELAPAGWAEDTAAQFAVVDRLTGDLLGSCGLVTVDRRLRSAEIGFWVVPEARGRRVAARSTRAIAHWAFDRLGLRRIVWQATVGNHPSRLAALRAGFRMEGRLRLAGAEPGTEGWIGSLLPGDLLHPPAEPPALEIRRARAFTRAQPVLHAQAKGGDLTLRALAERDIPEVVLACRDPESIRWTTIPQPYGPPEAELFVRRHAPARWAAGNGAVFALADEANRFVGSMELVIRADDAAAAAVGFMTAPGARGRGYAPAALRALCHWGFDALGLERIEWRAYPGNEPSRRVAEKAGFTMEGTIRSAGVQRGARRDMWIASLLATDPRELP